MAALGCYLLGRQHLPVERAAELMGDLFGARVSTGWLSGLLPAAQSRLSGFVADIRTLDRASKSKSRRRRPNRSRTGDAATRQVHSPTELSVLSDPDPADNKAGQIQMLVGLIATGALDNHLGTIQAAIAQRHNDRQQAASNQAAAHLQIGDRVILNHDIRPLYLHGGTGTGTVTGWASQNVIVQLDNPTGRFTTGQLRCPPLGLQRLPE